MKLVVNGQSIANNKWTEIIVPCEQSIFTCSVVERETSLTTYMRQGSTIVVRQYERGCTIPHEVENADEMYFHVCLWDTTDAELLDVTIDFKILHAKWTVYADDYDAANIRCSRD